MLSYDWLTLLPVIAVYFVRLHIRANLLLCSESGISAYQRSSKTTLGKFTVARGIKKLLSVTLERAWHIHHLSPVEDSPELHSSVVGLLDSLFIPGGFVYSMPPQDSLPFLPESPGLSLLSLLSSLDSISYLFAPELSASTLVQSDHTSLLSLAFLFNHSAYLIKPNFDPSFPSVLPDPSPLPMFVLLEATGLLPLPLIIPVPVSCLLPYSIQLIWLNLLLTLNRIHLFWWHNLLSKCP